MQFFTNNPDLATHTHGSLTAPNDPLGAVSASTFVSSSLASTGI